MFWAEIRMKVYLVRHAQSEANAGAASKIVSQIAITNIGVKQSKYVPDQFQSCDLIIYSKYKRTLLTALPFIKKFSSARIELWDIEEFTYLDQERCGLSTAAQRKPMVEEYWNRQDPDWIDGPGAESFNGFINRINTFLANLKNSDEQEIVVFGHGLFIKAVIWILTEGGDMTNFRQWSSKFDIPNCSITELELVDDEFRYKGTSINHLTSSLVTN